MASTSPDDRYTDPTTGVLRNKLGISDAAGLSEAEYSFTLLRRLELQDSPVPQTFDLTHLQAIHRHLFQDVYEWAGEVRTVNITKGDSFFHPAEAMAAAANHTFGKLAKSGLLTSTDLDDGEFITLAADLLSDLNYMHPFREGNGRTQRVFLDDVAARTGRELAWRNVGEAEHTAASIAAFKAGTGDAFVAVFRSVCAPPNDGRQVLDSDAYVVVSEFSAICGSPTSRRGECRRRGACPYHGRAAAPSVARAER